MKRTSALVGMLGWVKENWFLVGVFPAISDAAMGSRLQNPDLLVFVGNFRKRMAAMKLAVVGVPRVINVHQLHFPFLLILDISDIEEAELIQQDPFRS
jgi:hypothetical protein